MLAKKVALTLGVVALLAAWVTVAFSASNIVASSKVMDRTLAVGMAEKKPPECDFWSPTTIVAGSGTFNGTSAADLILGSSAADVVRANNGDDCVLGGAGVDNLRGDDGNDILWGGEGNDTLRGDAGTDVCIGQGGSDSFHNSCEYTFQDNP